MIKEEIKQSKWYFIVTLSFALLLLLSEFIHIEILVHKAAPINNDMIYARLGFIAVLSMRLLLYAWYPIVYFYHSKSEHFQKKLLTRFNHFFAYTIHFLVFIIILQVLDYPLQTLTYIRKYYFNLTSQSFWDFSMGYFTSVFIKVLIPSLFCYIFIWALRKYRQKWWLYLAGLSTILIFMGQIFYPLLIDPIMNPYEPIKQITLEEDVNDLIKKAELSPLKIYRVDRGEDTHVMNAYMTGMLGSQRIVLWSSLLKELNHRQTMNVIAHEIGHYKAGHVWKNWLWASAKVFMILMTIHLLIYHRPAGIRQILYKYPIDSLKILPLLFLLVILLLFIFRPLDMAISRKHEREADRYEVILYEDPEGAVDTLEKISRANLDVPSTSKLYKLFFQTHPSVQERIEFYLEVNLWDKENPGLYN